MIPFCILAIEDETDRAFMTNLFLSYQRLMFHEIFKVVHDEWATEDIMQNTIVKLIGKVGMLKEMTRDRLVNYIISSSKNTAYNYIRDQKHREGVPFEDYMETSDEDNDGHAMELRILKQEELDSLARVWPKLDEKNRLLLERYYILEKTPAELAEDLKVKPESVRMALTRARKAAYKLLADELKIKS